MIVTRPTLRRAAFAVAMLAAQPSHAAPADEAPFLAIRLDAAALGGGDTASIHDRIAAAARKVCAADGLSLADRMMARRCYVRAVRSGEVQLVALRQTFKGRQQALAAATR